MKDNKAKPNKTRYTCTQIGMGGDSTAQIFCSAVGACSCVIVTETKRQHESPGHWTPESKETKEIKMMRKEVARLYFL